MLYQDWLIVFIVIQFIHGLGTWKLYAKAGEKSWSAFVPVYNAYVLMRIINREWWLVFLLFLPVINIIMFVVIWVEIARSFGKNSYLDTFLTIISLGFYTYYLNYIEDVKYVKDRDVNPKSTTGEWTSSLIFAIIAATLVHNYVIQPYTIPTSSLEKSLLVGDFLFVSKFHYGARIPMTTIAAPMVHDSIPFTTVGFNQRKTPLKAKSYSAKYQIPYLRLPGFQKIKNNDIVVFNWPVDTLNNMYTHESDGKTYKKPIDKKTNYVKRAVAIAGDTLEIRDGYVYINGKKNELNERADLQFNYEIKVKDGGKGMQNLYPQLKSFYDINDGLYKNPSTDTNGNYILNVIAISDKTYDKLENNPNVESIEKVLAKSGEGYSNIFPNNKNHYYSNYNWNNDFFGPIYIPKIGSTIDLSIENLPLYKRVIEVYEKPLIDTRENNTIKIDAGKNNTIKVVGENIFINGELTTEYTFQQDYYWLMGDNRHNSQDSRTWGFVPFDHVVGKPVFKWLSWDSNGKGINKIRWDRMFTTVHGEGTPISFFVPFLILLGLYFGVKKWRKYKKED